MQPRPIKSTHAFCWRGVTARVSMTRNHRIEGWTLLDVVVVSPDGAPLPFAVDGRRHHGIEQDEIDAAGGLVPFLTAWAERDAPSAAYAIAVAKWKQSDLFST